MNKTEMIRARMAPDLKHDAEIILQSLGLSTTEAITLFYKQITLQQGLPFEVKLPNAETRAALNDAKMKRNLTKYEDVQSLITDFNNA